MAGDAESMGKMLTRADGAARSRLLTSAQRSAGNYYATALARTAVRTEPAPTGRQARLQRREMADPPSRLIGPTPQLIVPRGSWTRSDRANWTDRWKEACEYNLLNLRNEAYKEVAERRDFYKWFYEATAEKGYHTRWALAAYVVAANMAEIVDVDWSEGVAPVDNEIQGLARIGNQIIFDDVLPKLKKLWEKGPVTGADALKRDAEILSDEQHLVQAMYDTLSPGTMQRFERLSTGYYTRVAIGKWVPQISSRQAGQLAIGGKVKAGPYNKGGEVPLFTGDITKPEDRWKYGMKLAETFSTLPSPGPPGSMPTPGTEYSSGAAYKRLNVRPNLHMIDAMLNDANVPEKAVVKHLKGLTPSEQGELRSNAWRIKRLTGALSYAELKDGIQHLRTLSLASKFELLEMALIRSWTSVDYHEVQDMILLATQAQRTHLHTDRWKKVFIDICDDDTIVTATKDLGLPPAKAKEWIDAERSWF
jgi:hypothetical protein